MCETREKSKLRKFKILMETLKDFAFSLWSWKQKTILKHKFAYMGALNNHWKHIYLSLDFL